MSKKELLFSVTKKDFIIEPYKGSGKGGQHRNKTMSCCRIKHPDSGAVAQACEERDFHRNRKVAFRRLIGSTKFETWRKRKAYELLHDQKEFERKLDQLVEEAMRPENIKIEYL
jgi:peptide chain release factor 1